ncbi:MAG: helix-turn-helix domain-containing protein [Holosporaceae bacterium]|jgi:transcriptional regulator with XRE-family HTH domain|nr:helix-turn-helix domain-containing protein [Holosporaceae bacterium]
MSSYALSKSKRAPKDLDVYIGNKIKVRRSMLSISQERLGNFLGLTFQQVQKYEKGTNRVSASTLYLIASILDVNISYFTEGFEENNHLLHDDDNTSYRFDITYSKESTDLLKVYYKVEDPAVRRKIMELIKTFSTSIACSQQ